LTSPIKDKGGKETHHNKTPEVDMERVRAHIDSFPAMEPHYTRKNSNCTFRATVVPHVQHAHTSLDVVSALIM
jgi:hypothetical protein